MTIIQDFISAVQKTHATGNATEHSYRSAFEALFAGLSDDINALNEPKRVKCGAPDFIIHKGDIVIGHVEAKDLHVGLRSMKDANKNQQVRYKAALPNLIYTNCLDWDFYRDGERRRHCLYGPHQHSGNQRAHRGEHRISHSVG